MKQRILRGLCVFPAALAAIIFLSSPNDEPSPSATPSAQVVEANAPAHPAEAHGHQHAPAAATDSTGAPEVKKAANVSAPLALPGAPFVAPAAQGGLEVFGAFEAWRHRHAAATAADRERLLAEGERLARQRRAAMYSLVRTDPERALQQALPLAQRRDLPASITDELEHFVQGRGDYHVFCVYPIEADPNHPEGPLPLQRTVALNGQRYRASVYGARADHPTHDHLPLHGVALVEGDNAVMAVNEHPVQVLDPDEAALLGYHPARLEDSTCLLDDHPAASGPSPVLAALGGETAWFCSLEHAALMDMQLLEEAGTSGGHEDLPSPTPPGGRNSYTEGRKRVIIFRVAFPNVPTPAMAEDTGINLLANINDWFQRVSYGRLSIAPFGQGSDVVQVTLASPSSVYDGDAGALRSAVRSAASASGIDLSLFDFDITAVGGTPAYSFAGLGYVGAPGAWLANGYFGTGVTVHEIGHNLGLPHGNFWDTGDESDIGPGGNQEYGDSYDVMGGGPSDNGDYCSKFKNRLDWLTDTDYPRITTSGRFRLFAQDHPDSTGLRGLALPHEGSTDLSLEFRQRYTGNPWMMSGLGLRWGSGSGSQLIDTTPGTSQGKTDSPIVIGRTWHDPVTDVYVTPIGKGRTYPESLDVVVNFGPYPANQSPLARVQANLTDAGTGSAITFSVEASDPNGDELAYHWEFGDDGFGENGPVVTHAFTSAGEYAVQCTVSDMKGGSYSDSVLVRIGGPSTFTITGRVVKDGQPMAGVLVSASASGYAYSDSDGSYTITDLAAGSYNVTAKLHPYSFTGPWFSNPVTVGPDAQSIDFLGLESAIDDVVLVAGNAVWRYLDNGSDQGTAWRTSGFNDAGWNSGPAELGYGDDDEATEVGFGPDPDNKYPTTYFRHTFTVNNLSTITNINLRLFRDDGGVVYLNGTEILRDNMPAGTITYQTYASSASEEAALAGVPNNLFNEGPNVLAVEIHQVLPDSSDISFSASLTATAVTNLQGISLFYIASPLDNEVLIDPSFIPIRVAAFSSGASYTLMEFFVDGAEISEDATAPFVALWGAPTLGEHTIQVRATDSTGATSMTPPVRVVVTTAPIVSTLVPAGSSWKFLDNGSDLGTAWREPQYNDLAWSSGPAPLGYGDNDEATVVGFGGTSSTKFYTTYFRHAFQVDDPTLVTDLIVGLQRDDGGVVYLNGVEVFRSNMPAGTIDYLTPAAAVVGGNDEDAYSESAVDPALLVVGSNHLAVEIHQVNQTSSDISFDLYLNAELAGSPTPGVRLTQPSEGSLFTAPATLPLAAVATPEPGQTVTEVAFLANGVPLFTDTTPPYTYQWDNPPAQSHMLVAEAHLSGGGVLTSDAVLVEVTNPDVPTQLVPPGGAWKFWDAGYEPAANWSQRAYDDDAWHEGHARIGYGGDGEVTEISYGSDAGHKHITTWLRRHFAVTDPSAFDLLKLRFSRDDGVVIYLNGTEVLRDNIQPGPVHPSTLATAGIGGADEAAILEGQASAALLVAGDNVLAVELHQATIDSSDLGFDLQLIGCTDTNLTEGIYITRPSAGSTLLMPGTVPLESFVASTEAVTLVEYFADGFKVGESASPPFAATWSAPVVGSHVLTARATRNGALALDSPPVTVQVDAPPTIIQPVAEIIIPARTFWRVNDSGADLGTAWQRPNFTEIGWRTGLGRFGYGLDGETTTVTNGFVTTYYRRPFTVNNPELLEHLLVELQRDDGAVVYLNGHEIFRSNMPSGLPTASTLAVATMHGLDEHQYLQAYVPMSGSGLIRGTNVLAVEIHQSSANSSDSGFDLALSAAGSTDRRLYLASPGMNDTVELPGNVSLEAFVHAGPGRSITHMEFFANGASLGVLNSPPWTLPWADPEIGEYTLAVEAVDDVGALVQSEPVQVTVGFPQVATALVPEQSVWRFLDNGSNQGTAWAQPGYSDTGWNSGPARLGYGGDGEATTVGFGGNANNKYFTTYFRHTFELPASVIYTNLLVRLQRDDGAVVYLNGAEIFRSNMPGGAISYTTPAAGTVSGGGETDWFTTELSAANLVPGDNVIAAEVHQINATSSDLGFDLSLTGYGFTSGLQPEPELQFLPLTFRRILLQWPQAAVGFSLYQSTALPPDAVWTPVGLTPATTNDNFYVVVFANDRQRFYQLRSP